VSCRYQCAGETNEASKSRFRERRSDRRLARGEMHIGPAGEGRTLPRLSVLGVKWCLHGETNAVFDDLPMVVNASETPEEARKQWLKVGCAVTIDRARW
jgi:hypothetical protein